MIFNAICFALSGFFMKISDELMDEDDNLVMAIITGILCVLFTSILSVRSGDAACIFISILVGTALAFKVDTWNHILSAILLILILFILGVPYFSWYCLVLCTVAVFFDEKGNDFADKKEEESRDLTLIDKMLKYRYFMKITVFILSLLGLIKILVPNTLLDAFIFFEPVTIIYFYLFDLGYEFSVRLTDTFNNFFQSLMRRF